MAALPTIFAFTLVALSNAPFATASCRCNSTSTTLSHQDPPPPAYQTESPPGSPTAYRTEVSTPEPWYPVSNSSCTNITITSTIYPSTSTPSASPSCTNSTTTVTIYPSIATSHTCHNETHYPTPTPLPSEGTGVPGTGAGYPPYTNRTGVAHTLYQPTSPPSSTEVVETQPATSEGGYVTDVLEPPAPEEPPQDGSSVLPEPPVGEPSPTAPEEPLFTGGASNHWSGMSGISVAVVAGVMILCM